MEAHSRAAADWVRARLIAGSRDLSPLGVSQ
jgi:hypothetical protein